MNARERYYWDLTGHLVVPGVLSEREVDDINRTLDYVIDSGAVSESEGGSRNSTFLQGGKTRWSFANLLDLPGDYASPIRPLLVHPEVVVRLRTMCGPGFRLDHGPQFQNARKGAEGLTLHGAGAPHRDFVAYHNQAGEMYCGGVTVTWNLTDCPAGGGGFAAAPGSHPIFRCRLAQGTAMTTAGRSSSRRSGREIASFSWMARRRTGRIPGKTITSGDRS